ncbi:hypothetical protein MHSWG343_05240 [Candidatus Mycoplasma haematohominis]|uniref:Uncharacterized protein n=1 Tax=Candidatus Mycoplasma haematohominis TaxID=1494318 RepID=A0A478FQW9_9MOLU|nr:hypothetical protein MHSWG343_05240 [Candidatus Mycoplasma haemohominis]
MALTKAAAAGAGAILIASGGYGVSTIFTKIPNMPNVHSVIKESSAFSTNYASGKFGHTYGDYLVDSNKTENKDWWEWSFNYIFWNTSWNDLSKQFKGVKQAYTSDASVNSATHLNRVCETAYKDTKANLEAEANSKYASNVWSFCSLFINKLVTVDQSLNKDGYSTSSGKIGHEQKSKLISAVDKRNDLFWKFRTDEFFADTGTRSGKTATNEKFFHKFYNDNKDLTDKPSIKSRCNEGYEKSSGTSDSSDTNPKPDEVVKFCTLEGN